MKKSNYNIFVHQKGLTICYNSFTHTLLCVSKNVYETFNTAEDSEFKNKFPNHYETFVENGFLISEDRNELDEIRLNHKIATFTPSRNFQLMVFPTQDCNLKCWYCYETHISNSKIADDIQKNIIKFVERKIQNRELDHFNLAFFGGEPLLYFDKVAYPLSCIIRDICNEHNVMFTTFFVTNGSLINENNIDKLKSINPSFQITLDGNKTKHNKVRIGKYNNAPTYDKIIKALHLISDNISSGHINTDVLCTLRINYDNDTLKDIDDLIEDIIDLNRSKFIIHLERVWQTMDLVEDEQKELLFATMRKFIVNGFDIHSGNFKKSNFSCPAEKIDYAIVNYDGHVYRCNGRTLEKGKHEGVLTSEGVIEWDPVLLSKRLGRTTFENPMCISCKILPVCMGPCSQKSMEMDWKDLHEVCSLKYLGLPLNQYLSLWAESLYMKEKGKRLIV